ncbi:MAG: helix-turn-helix domain-containing protein [Chloroflexi bacterium]|nr:helix-turn-helix domain-containing protein [Chloroflexota bacterium]
MRHSIESKPAGSGNPVQLTQQTAGLSQETKQILRSLLTRVEVGHLLGVCPHTVQRLTRKGVLPAIVFNRRLIRYSPDAVESYIRAAMGGAQ